MWFSETDLWVVGPALAAVLVGSSEAFYRGGRASARDVSPELRSQFNAVQAAVLGLLGLLLAFTLNMSVTRYETRRQLVVEEANAIGTAYLRAGVLPEGTRARMRDLLRRYVDNRIAFFEAGNDEAALAAVAETDESILHDTWTTAVEEVRRAPTVTTNGPVLESLNLVIDLNASRLAARNARIPEPIHWVNALVAVVGVGLVGFCFGLVGGGHRYATASLAVLLAGVMLVILDLDRPTRGLIQVNQRTMLDLRESISRGGD